MGNACAVAADVVTEKPTEPMNKPSLPVFAIVALVLGALAPSMAPASSGELELALSEIKTPDLPASEDGLADNPGTPDMGAPSSDEIEREPLPAPETGAPEPEQPASEPGEEQSQPLAPTDGQEAALPEIIYDLSRLPEPVARMRQLIVEACRSGDPENLRPLIGMGDGATQLALGSIEGDPIAFLREISGDETGQEILAILLEILEAGFVHLEPGTRNEVYVWPYFFALPLESLEAPQRVELFKIVTAGDYEDMKNFGAYNFYRTGITPDGQWVFFVAGD